MKYLATLAAILLLSTTANAQDTDYYAGTTSCNYATECPFQNEQQNVAQAYAMQAHCPQGTCFYSVGRTTLVHLVVDGYEGGLIVDITLKTERVNGVVIWVPLGFSGYNVCFDPAIVHQCEHGQGPPRICGSPWSP